MNIHAIVCSILFLLMMLAAAHADSVTCRSDAFDEKTVRCSDGTTWKRNAYGRETWKDNHGTECKRDTYDYRGKFTCKN